MAFVAPLSPFHTGDHDITTEPLRGTVRNLQIRCARDAKTTKGRRHRTPAWCVSLWIGFLASVPAIEKQNPHWMIRLVRAPNA
jgi:hypothetical protein